MVLYDVAYCNIKSPVPWCAALLSWVFEGRVQAAEGSLEPCFVPKTRLTKEPKPGIVYGIYFAGLGRIGHCGISERLQGNFIVEIEGNTNLAVSTKVIVFGGKSGTGVRYIRYADWF